MIKTDKKSFLPGEDVFKLSDTFGFPVDLTKEIAAESGLEIDIAGFNTLMAQQKQRARMPAQPWGSRLDGRYG